MNFILMCIFMITGLALAEATEVVSSSSPEVDASKRDEIMDCLHTSFPKSDFYLIQKEKGPQASPQLPLGSNYVLWVDGTTAKVYDIGKFDAKGMANFTTLENEPADDEFNAKKLLVKNHIKLQLNSKSNNEKVDVAYSNSELINERNVRESNVKTAKAIPLSTQEMTQFLKNNIKTALAENRKTGSEMAADFSEKAQKTLARYNSIVKSMNIDDCKSTKKIDGYVQRVTKDMYYDDRILFESKINRAFENLCVGSSARGLTLMDLIKREQIIMDLRLNTLNNCMKFDFDKDIKAQFQKRIDFLKSYKESLGSTRQKIVVPGAEQLKEQE